MNKNSKENIKPWSNKIKFGLTWLLYSLLAILIGAFWHAKLFVKYYKEANFITATEINVPLAIGSMLLLGYTSTYFFSKIYQANSRNYKTILIAINVLLLPRMVVTFAQVAEQNVNGKGLNLIVLEFGLYLIISIIWGGLSGKIYDK